MKDLSKLLKQVRKETGISINQLAQLTGISRRTLARIESGKWDESRGTGHKSRTAHRLAAFLLPEKSLKQVHEDATRLPFPFDVLDTLQPDQHMRFLFHQAPLEPERSADPERASRRVERAAPSADDAPSHPGREAYDQLRREYIADFGEPWLRLVRLSPHNLRQRLRVFRLKHNLTFKDLACVLELSLSHLHAIESGARHPSPRVRFKLLRLLSLPITGRGGACPEAEGRRVPPVPSTAFLDRLKLELSLPAAPPQAGEAAAQPPGGREEEDPRDLLRWLWLHYPGSTRELAAQLEISQPHLIRLLRNDRRPSRALRHRIQNFDLIRYSEGSGDHHSIRLPSGS